MNKNGSNSISILFKNYNNFIIPHQEIGDKKTLILNTPHASLTTDSKLYDESLKIIFYFDTKEFTVRDEYGKRSPLCQEKLEKFLIEEIEKYHLPNLDKCKKEEKYNYKVVVENYNLPKTKENKGNFEKGRVYAIKTVETLQKIGGIEAINFAQIQIKNAIDSIPGGLGNNLSDYTICKMSFDAVNEVADFFVNEKINKKKISYIDGEYYINFIFLKEKI